MQAAAQLPPFIDRIANLVGEQAEPGRLGRHLAVMAAVWAVLSLLLVLFRPGYLFPPFELVDSWIYSAYMWDPRSQVAEFGSTYYGSRLSWILPGAVLHSVLPPVCAHLCFKLLFSAAFAVSCGFTAYRASGMAGGILGVAFGTLAPQVIAALHADYIDSPVFVYGALALACIAGARDSRHWPVWVFVAGVFYSCMAVANLSALSNVGLGIAAFHLCWLPFTLRRLAVSALIYLGAAIVVLGIFGWIHTLLGGPFHFLKPQVDMVLFFKAAKETQWSPKDWTWAAGSTWLIIPVGAMMIGCYRSFAGSMTSQSSRGMIRVLTLALAVSLGAALLLEFRRIGVLYYYYYASFYLCLALPLLAACAAPEPGQNRRTAVRLGGLLVFLLLFMLVGKPLRGWQSLAQVQILLGRPDAIANFVTLLLLTAAAVIARGWLGRWAYRQIRPEWLPAALLVASMPFGYHAPQLSDRLRERYELVHAAFRQITREFPANSYRFWVHPGQRDGVSLASTKLWGYRLFSMEAFPVFEVQHISQRTVIIPAPLGRGEEVLRGAAAIIPSNLFFLSSQRVVNLPGSRGRGFDLAMFTIEKKPFDPEAVQPEGTTVTLLANYLYHATPPYLQYLGSVIHKPDTGPVLDTKLGYPVFTPTDKSDHLATYFTTFPNPRPGTERLLAIVCEMPAAGDTYCALQNSDFRVYKEMNLTEAGRHVFLATLPADAIQLRFYFMSREAVSTPLPTRITLYEVNLTDKK